MSLQRKDDKRSPGSSGTEALRFATKNSVYPETSRTKLSDSLGRDEIRHVGLAVGTRTNDLTAVVDPPRFDLERHRPGQVGDLWLQREHTIGERVQKRLRIVAAGATVGIGDTDNVTQIVHAERLAVFAASNRSQIGHATGIAETKRS